MIGTIFTESSFTYKTAMENLHVPLKYSELRLVFQLQ